MAVVVRMPEVATGGGEAAIQTWLVEQGTEIAAGQPIVEIETEKAVVEVEAEEAGVLAGILLAAGESAQVGSPIAVLATAGQSAEEAMREAGMDASASAAGESAVPGVRGVAADSDAPAELSKKDTLADVTAPEARGFVRIFASPLVRKLARERGIQLADVTGSGPNGRIVRRDLDDLPAAADSVAVPEADQQAQMQIQPQVQMQATPAAQPTPAFEDVPHTGMRRAIARRLAESKRTVPHFYLVADCRVDELLKLRARINEQDGVRISVNDLVIKAAACAMRDVPDANAIWTDEATRRFDSADIAVAVSVPTGLLTPVVRDVGRLSVSELSAMVRDLATRAREGRLKQHELEGGSFSISNLGMYGTREFSAIINPPHAGILAVGAADRRPVVQTDGTLGVASVMTVTLSADHRVLDGALAAQWLAAFQKRIENPMSILV